MNGDGVLGEELECGAEMLDEVVDRDERSEMPASGVKPCGKRKIVAKKNTHGSSTSASKTRSNAICARLKPSAITSAEGLLKRQKLTSSSGM